MRQLSWWALCLVIGGAVGCGTESHGPPVRFDDKEDALARMSEPDFEPTPGEDVCADNEWYGDGECDFWCPSADSDCAGTDDIVCAAFVEDSDGVCRRSPMDPCRSQDPDCDVACVDLPIFPGTDGVCEYDPADPCMASRDRDCDPIYCALYEEMPDGMCSRSDDDPCRSQDPDCDANPPIQCRAIAQLPDGICSEDPTDPCVALSDPDCDVVCNNNGAEPDFAPPTSDGVCNEDMNPCTPRDPDCTCDNMGAFDPAIEDGVCVEDNDPCTPADPDCYGCGPAGIRAAPPSDGVCEMLPCALPDPDCANCGAMDAFIAPPGQDGVCTEDNDPCTPVDPDCVACAEYIEVSDGVCSRMPGDPCIFQDPDCHMTCLLPIGPLPADGMCVPTNDPCQPDPDCTICAFFAPPPESDGVCSGNPNEPCSFQGDPDCTVICADYIEMEDGQCNRYSADGCIGQDPDCVASTCETDEARSPDQLCPFPLDSMCRLVDPDCNVDL